MKRYVLGVLIGASVLLAMDTWADPYPSPVAIADDPLEVYLDGWGSLDDSDDFIIASWSFAARVDRFWYFASEPVHRAFALPKRLPRVRGPPSSPFSQ